MGGREFETQKKGMKPESLIPLGNTKFEATPMPECSEGIQINLG
jgi:hypothetical protein